MRRREAWLLSIVIGTALSIPTVWIAARFDLWIPILDGLARVTLFMALLTLVAYWSERNPPE